MFNRQNTVGCSASVVQHQILKVQTWRHAQIHGNPVFGEGPAFTYSSSEEVRVSYIL